MPDDDTPVMPLKYRDTINCFDRGLVIGNQVAQILRVLDAKEAVPDIGFGTSHRNRANTPYAYVKFEEDTEPTNVAYKELLPKMVDRLIEAANDVTTTACFGFEHTEKFKRFAERLQSIKEDSNIENYGREFKMHLAYVLDGSKI